LRSLRAGLALAPSSGIAAPPLDFLDRPFVGLAAAGAAAGPASVASDASTGAGVAVASAEVVSVAGCLAIRRLGAGFLAAAFFGVFAAFAGSV